MAEEQPTDQNTKPEAGEETADPTNNILVGQENHNDDDVSMSDAGQDNEADVDDVDGVSDANDDDADETNSLATSKTGDSVVTPLSRKRAHSEASLSTSIHKDTTTPTESAAASAAKAPSKGFKKGHKCNHDGHPRMPAVRDLTIPYRPIKKSMKSNLDLPLVQNDAAILVTQATELFIKKLAKDSSEISAKKGRGTIKYDDLAEARAKNKAFSFLDLLIP